MFKKAEKIFSANKKKAIISIMLPALITLVVLIFLLSIAEYIYFDFFTDKDKSIIRIHAAALLVLTLIFICVAWFQLKNLNITSKADFLLRIDDRFGSREIIRARKIIHEFYCETNQENIRVETHINNISEKIKEICEDKDKAEDFVYLLNFLDFLETISYFCHKDYIEPVPIAKTTLNTVLL